MPNDESSKMNSKQSAAEFDAIIRAAVDGVIVIDERGSIQLFNAGAENIFGYHEHDVIGRNVSMLMPAPDRDRHDGYIANYLSGCPPKIIGNGREVSGMRRNGEIFPMELTVGEAHTEETHRFVGLIKDITVRRETEKALQTSELRYRTLFDRAPLGIFTADRNGIFQSLNQILIRMLGYVESELDPDMGCVSMCEDSSVSAAQSMLDFVRSSTEGSAFERLHWKTKSGERLVVDVHLTCVGQRENQDFIIGHVTDRTREVEAAAGLQLAQRRIAQAGRLTTLGEMATAIAHEINQPLTAISTYAQACRRLLDADDSDPQVIRPAFDSIYEQSMRAGEVVRRIRGFVRDRESTRRHEDINDIVTSSVDLAAFELRESKVETRLELAPGLPRILVDRIQIQQVCLNLIRNAIDALAEKRSEREIVLLTSTSEDRIQVSVADNGDGIAEELQPTLFQPFLTTKEHGMGLGLSISQSIIDTHGGKLAYANAEGGGAIFTFELPAGEPNRE